MQDPLRPFPQTGTRSTGDEDARPGEVGLESLALAELLVILERAAAQAGAPDLQEALHIPVLQRLTVSEISALIRGFSRTVRPTG